MRVIYQYFIGKGFTCIKSCFYNFLCFFAPKTVFSGLADIGHKNFGVEKSIFLDFWKVFSNHFLSMNMAWKCVLEALGASFWQFLSCYGGIITPCKNLKFSKNAIFTNFSDFLMMVVLDAKRHKNVWKSEIFQKYVL